MTQLTIENVKQKFDLWRQTAKRCTKMPKYLIDDAKELSKHCNRHTLFKELNIDKSKWFGKEIIKFQDKYLNSLDINILRSSHINYMYPKILKKEIISQLKKGIKICDLTKKFNIPYSTIYNWNRRKHSKKYKKLINLQLLKDIYNIFNINKISKISSLDLISHLCKYQHWSDYNTNTKYKNIHITQLCLLLTPRNIRSKSIKFEGHKYWKKGYEKNQFEQVWKTYGISTEKPFTSPESTIQDVSLAVSHVPSVAVELERLLPEVYKYTSPEVSPKNLNMKDFKEYLQKFENVKYEKGVFYINNTNENRATTLKEKNVATKNKCESETDNYIFATKFICSLIISLFFLKLSYFEMLSIFSISYGFFSIIEYFILDIRKDIKKRLSA